MTHYTTNVIPPAALPEGIAASLMSDTKWYKLFATLDRADLVLNQVIIKFVDVDKEYAIRKPGLVSLYKEGFVETFDFGSVALRDIEWIEFPEAAEVPDSSRDDQGRVPSPVVMQDIAKAEALLTAVGQFPMERTARGLRITGHVRRATAAC